MTKINPRLDTQVQYRTTDGQITEDVDEANLLQDEIDFTEWYSYVEGETQHINALVDQNGNIMQASRLIEWLRENESKVRALYGEAEDRVHGPIVG